MSSQKGPSDCLNRYKDHWGHYFLNIENMQIYFVSHKSHRDRNRAYHAEIVNLSAGYHVQFKAIDPIPVNWTQVDIEVKSRNSSEV